MEGWATFWKVIFICSVTAFGLMAVWVTFGGFLDIKRMFSELRSSASSEPIKENEAGTAVPATVDDREDG
ncbi:MAG: hypothetical protein ABIH23_35830 [bacterium]